jgi:hypothetical protein
MKIALVCIAKNEDNYIKEWCDYHLKLGFDDIFIYQNNWRTSIFSDKIHNFEIDGVSKQIESYNSFINNFHSKYDWAAFFDVDEFLVLKKHNNVKDFISEYSNYNSIGVNWVLFGDNGLNDCDNGNYEVIKRFTKRQSKINPHIKSIVKLNPNVRMSVHNPNCTWVDTNNIEHTGPFNYQGNDDVAIINHYFCKTKKEFITKVMRGRADTGQIRNLSDFDSNNFNDVEDLTAYNFYYDNNNLLNT